MIFLSELSGRIDQNFGKVYLTVSNEPSVYILVETAIVIHPFLFVPGK